MTFRVTVVVVPSYVQHVERVAARGRLASLGELAELERKRAEHDRVVEDLRRGWELTISSDRCSFVEYSPVNVPADLGALL